MNFIRNGHYNILVLASVIFLANISVIGKSVILFIGAPLQATPSVIM